MNTFKISLTFVALASMIIYLSCSKKEQVYSCESSANEYAKMNAVASQHITRDSLVKLERGLQFAVFRSLNPENKKRIYNEKIDLLLRTNHFSEEEQKHLLAAKAYDDLTMYLSDEKEVPFLTQWEYKAKNELHWSEDMIQGMLGTWATPEELGIMAGKGTLQYKGKDCTCKYDIGCAAIGDCKGGGCDNTQDGCGLFSSLPCTGNCPEDRIKPGSSSGIAM